MQHLDLIAEKFAAEYCQTSDELKQAPLELRMKNAYIMAARKKCASEAVCQGLQQVITDKKYTVTPALVKRISRNVNGINISGSLAKQYFNKTAVKSSGQVLQKAQEQELLQVVQYITCAFKQFAGEDAINCSA